MLHYFHEGGWGMYPIFIFGAFALGLAVTFVLAPDKRELRPLVLGFTAATLLAGCLGTAVGVQHSAAYIHQVENARKWIFLVGLKESLNCFVAAFVIATVVSLIMTAGGFRGERRARIRAEHAAPANA